MDRHKSPQEEKRPLVRGKRRAACPQTTGVTPVKVPAARVKPFFRRADWVAALITFVATWIVYYLTLAPEVTLEDAGELITGATYAGIPHPPGYPVWTIYAWLWTVLVPFGNMAWRVALAQANASAVACGLLALLVSRGSALLIESIDSLSSAERLPVTHSPGQSAVTAAVPTTFNLRLTCALCGIIAGLLMGLDGFMWRESVAANRMAVASVPWFLLVLVCLLRWLYAPEQRRYLYWALFLFGLCFTTHQSLVVASIGIEVLIAAAHPRLGRDLLLGNGVIYLAYNLFLCASGQHLFHNLGAKPGLLLLFHAIGIGSLIAGGWLALRTKGVFTQWKPVLIMGLVWLLGVSVYFYLPLSGMSNPPMEWAYPRTVEGFFHALTRGQYEQPSPVNVFLEPGRFLGQLGMLVSGVAESFTWVLALVALIPFLFLKKLRSRERAWLLGLAALYLCLGVLLMILLNPTPERASADLVKVFFNNSHTIIAALIGYGLALTVAFMAAHYEQFRRWGIVGAGVSLLLAIYSLVDVTARHFRGPGGKMSMLELPHWIGTAFGSHQYGLPVLAGLFLVLLAAGFLSLLLLRRLAPVGLCLGIFAALPLYSGVSHWFECDQRGHLFGYWFGHDMFTPPFKGADQQPLFPPMTKDAILFGGTDPGRFCPTYMIFCESFTPHKCQPPEDRAFDRRDVYIITQNALADPPYLDYIRAQYHRSAQVDPPFFSELARTALKDSEYETNLLSRIVRPLDSTFTSLGEHIEKRRRTCTSWFAESDFVDLPAFTAKLRPDLQQDPVSKFLYENLSAKTQQMVCARQESKSLRSCLTRDLNLVLEREVNDAKHLNSLLQQKVALDQRIAAAPATAKIIFKRETLEKEIAEANAGPDAVHCLYTPDRFAHTSLSPYLTAFIGQNPQSHTRIRLNRLLLETAYPHELAQSPGGVYPDQEIYTPSVEDQQHAFQEYSQDAFRRMQLGQLRPGEDVKLVDGKIMVGGTVAVMSINALLAKTIFDRNPNHEFFIEESFPLDWMYPYLTPHGVIMKLKRQPLASIPEDTLRRDHEFWKQYSRRLTGDIIDSDTPVRDICAWLEKTSLRSDFSGFTGDRKFIHDIDAQKSFSKLRTAIAGIYAWRLSQGCPAELRPKSQPEFLALVREANFAFLQAFAFCPWSPEAVLRYANFLLQCNRIDDALLIAETCLKFDPYDGQVSSLADNLRQIKRQMQTSVPPRS